MTERPLTSRETNAAFKAWSRQVEAVLKGASFEQHLVSRTYDGLTIEPLYTERDALPAEQVATFPGCRPNNRGAKAAGNLNQGWDIRALHTHPDATIANRQILDDLARGCHSLLLRFDRATRAGLDPGMPEARDRAGQDGLMVGDLTDLEHLLAGVRLDACGVALDAGAAFLPAAALVVALCRRHGMDPAGLQGTFGADPLGSLARDGALTTTLEQSLAQLVQLVNWSRRHSPAVRPIWISTAAYHDAGATSAWDLGIAMATAIAYLRALTDAGLDIDSAARQIGFSISVGCRFFQATAKLRAAQALWSRVVAACGGSADAGSMQLHVSTATRVITRVDPWVNMLRNTTCCFAAAMAGAGAITSAAFDGAASPPGDLGRRIARNTQIILREEANLHRVIDPAGGSWFVESLTDRMARKGWEVMQEIESRGGMAACLTSGWVASRIEETWRARLLGVALQKDAVTGVSLFADPQESDVNGQPPDLEALHRQAAARLTVRRKAFDTMAGPARKGAHEDPFANLIEAALAGAGIADLVALTASATAQTADPLPCRCDAEPFERLHSACDAHAARTGRRPTVFLANMGPISRYVARVAYARDFFQVGGFKVIESESCDRPEAAAEAFAGSGAAIAVICTADDRRDEFVAATARLLAQRGARTLILAGRPDEHRQVWAEVGLDRYIYQSCNVLATLTDLLREEGIEP